MPRTVIAAALVFLAACEPVPETPVRAQVLVLSGGKYAPKEVTLTTLTDVIHMEGSVAKLVGGASIVVDSSDPEQQAALNSPDAENAYANALLKAEGHPVTANWIVKDKVLWPADFHTWNLVTAYYNFEKAREYFAAVGTLRDADFGQPATIYYFPEFILKDTSSEPMKDNALWFPITQSFMVVPFDQLQEAPIAINSGVMSHEYSHMIFNKLVYEGHRLPVPLLLWGSQGASPGANLLKALDEGLADYHGYGVTCRSETGCDANFLSTSFGDNVSAARDLTTNRCINDVLLTKLNTATLGEFSGDSAEYELGSIFASAFYQAGQKTGQHAVLQRALIDAYSETVGENIGLSLKELIKGFALNNQQNFNLISVSGVFINHVRDVPLKTALCNELIDRLKIPAAELVGPNKPCPAAAQGGGSCPR